MEVSGQRQAPTALPPGKGPFYQFYRRLGGPHSRSVRYGTEKNLLRLLGIEPRFLGRPTRNLVAIPKFQAITRKVHKNLAE
jgi:hypothetical protein